MFCFAPPNSVFTLNHNSPYGGLFRPGQYLTVISSFLKHGAAFGFESEKRSAERVKYCRAAAIADFDGEVKPSFVYRV